MSSPVPDHLYLCATAAAQEAWIRRALVSGHVLTDSGLWLGGVDRPAEIMSALRATGMAVVTTTKKVVDAADEEHEDLAWHLAPAPLTN